MRKIISIGERGTAFADLNESQLVYVTLDAVNPVFKKTFRSKDQLERRDNGEHHCELWSDSRSWISKRGGQFWLGAIDTALKQKLIRKVTIIVATSGGFQDIVGYVRANYADGDERKNHRIIAAETALGRLETKKVPKESGIGHRNAKHVHKVLQIVLHPSC